MQIAIAPPYLIRVVDCQHAFQASETADKALSDFRTMTLRTFAILILLVAPAMASAQQAWDEMDVLDGPNPTLRYGFYSEPSGQLQMGRYYFIDDGTTLRVRLVPFGKTARELPVRAYDRSQGMLELGWEGRPDRTCRLEQQNERLFLGNCIEGLSVMPMAIRVANAFDVEWQGTYFPVSEADLAIVKKAMEVFEAQEQRNLEGDRNCDDDMASGRLSVFCALYAASIEVAGVYRHRRPAIQAVRDHLWERFPGDYVHMLRDINNNAAISDSQLLDAFDSAYTALQSHLGSTWE